MDKVEEKIITKAPAAKEFIFAIGRRKSSTAEVRLYKKDAVVWGGTPGKTGQLDAIILGLARALDKIDREKFHTALKKKGMLTRDPRVKERRKVGMGGKSRRRKQSPKR